MVAAYKKQKLDKSGKAKNAGKKVEKVEVERESSSEEEQASEPEDEEEDDEEALSDLESMSDMDENDEVDVADVSSSEEDDSDDDEDDERIPKLKKKKNLDDGSESFANAFNAIIGSRLKAYDRKDPILARSKTSLKKLESDKLEAKAKRLINAEKKEHQDNCRVKVLLPAADKPEEVRTLIEKEKKLKKIAQRGVVRLFNAVLSTQIKTNQDMDKEKGLGVTRKEELMNEISKEKFLDLVQAAGQS
ncbi:ribosomal RNA-processing protein 15 [[Candida] anglica]|uniref:Ribosomal RNA-processing protein 15 n=1 Tax=[Candida] anglica TaxID=148631 RepID=A0ABP0E8B1_9ASCO